MPYRQLEGFTRSLHKLVPKLPPADYSGLRKRILALPVDPYQSLNEKQEPISIAVDSTGIKVNRAGGWIERKHGKKKRYVKLHFAVDIESKEVVAMNISTDDVHDVKAFPVLLEEAGKRRKIKRCLGDGAYDSSAVFDALEASLNVNEKQLVGRLLNKVLGESIEIELLVGDSQFESQLIFSLLESHQMGYVIPWRRLKRRVNPCTVLSVWDRIDVVGPEHLRCVYHRLRATCEGFIGWVKSWLGYRRLTWQGLDNVCIHVCLVLMVAYAVCIVAPRLGRPELGQSVAYFA